MFRGPLVLFLVVVVVVTWENKVNQPTLVEFDLQVGVEFDNLIIVINFIWCYKFLRAFPTKQK